jgi:hypothetical protein
MERYLCQFRSTLYFKGIHFLHFDVILAYKSNVNDMIAIYVNKTVNIVDGNKYRCYLFIFKTYQKGEYII